VTKVIGACNASVGILDTLADISGHPADELFMSWKGLNHLTFVDAVYHDGRNILEEILEKLDDSNLGSLTVPAALIKSLGVLPHQYLQYYFRRRAIADKLQHQERVRSEVVKEINERLYEQYKDAEAMPDELRLRGGYRYSEVVVELMAGIAAGLGTVHYAVVRNNGTLADLDDDAFVEVPVVARREGPVPLQMGPLPLVARSLVLAVKDYERLAIAGAAHRDRRMLLNALMVHPLIGSFEVAEPLLEDCLALNEAFLPVPV
jgi:6-phospho-beta-glucosidase